jgi:16S rRNA (adenine1518-N6/adenine1519-N6)-dimethyltransferase
MLAGYMSRPTRQKSDKAPKERFEHKKSLGQNFLTSSVVPNWMCDAAAITPGDIVVEIGPGTGALTRVLLERGAHVVAVEADARAIPILETEFADALALGTLILSHSDARELDITSLIPKGTPYKIVANIPYYLSGFLLRICLGHTPPPDTLVFLMQKEMVERITRDPKSSLLSLSVAVYGTPKYVKTVTRGHFSPSPKVDSAIVAITNISHVNLPSALAAQHFFTHLHIGFGQKRKQLLGNLAAYYDRDKLQTLFINLKLIPTIRAEDIPMQKWLDLHHMLVPLVPHTPLPTQE